MVIFAKKEAYGRDAVQLCILLEVLQPKGTFKQSRQVRNKCVIRQ